MQEVGLADAIETQEYMYNCMREVGLADAIETQEDMFDLTACGAGGLQAGERGRLLGALPLQASERLHWTCKTYNTYKRATLGALPHRNGM